MKREIIANSDGLSYPFCLAVVSASREERSIAMLNRLMNERLYIELRKESMDANKLRMYSESFSDTLFELMKEKKMSKARLAIESNLSEKTIQRLRNDDRFEPTKQTVIALCVGLKLSLVESMALIRRSPYQLRPTNPQDAAYLKIISSGQDYCIEEVNECLEALGLSILGGTA